MVKINLVRNTLQSLKMTELRQLARENGLTINSKMTRIEIIKQLINPRWRLVNLKEMTGGGKSTLKFEEVAARTLPFLNQLIEELSYRDLLQLKLTNKRMNAMITDEILFEKKLNDLDRDIDKALLWASKKGNFKAVKYFITQGADVNVRDTRTGRRPLIWAVVLGNIDMVKYLVENGADINARDLWGLTALTYAKTGVKRPAVTAYLKSQGGTE